MMRILLVEDDDRKRHLIQHFLSEELPDIEVSVALSYNSALKAIRYSSVDMILLDMSLTTFDPSPEEDGGTPRPFAGRELLGQMERRSIVVPAIVVTQYPRFGEGPNRLTLHELHQQLIDEYPSVYLGTVYYNESIEGWKEELTKLVNSVRESNTE
jgi:CheY-like chemotaxis protein